MNLIARLALALLLGLSLSTATTAHAAGKRYAKKSGKTDTIRRTSNGGRLNGKPRSGLRRSPISAGAPAKPAWGYIGYSSNVAAVHAATLYNISTYRRGVGLSAITMDDVRDVQIRFTGVEKSIPRGIEKTAKVRVWLKNGTTYTDEVSVREMKLNKNDPLAEPHRAYFDQQHVKRVPSSRRPPSPFSEGV